MKNSATNPPKPDEYSRFRELTKHLLAVPKKEVDKEKAKYDQRKEKRPAK